MTGFAAAKSRPVKAGGATVPPAQIGDAYHGGRGRGGTIASGSRGADGKPIDAEGAVRFAANPQRSSDPSCARALALPAFSSGGGRRKKALTALIQRAYVQGASTIPLHDAGNRRRLER